MTDTVATSERLADEWHTTACVLCSINCGLEVRLDGPTIKRVRGDKSHPGSEGYTCEKGLRIDHYQNGPHRLTSPLRRRDDANRDRYLRRRSVRWKPKIVDGLSTIAERITRRDA